MFFLSLNLYIQRYFLQTGPAYSHSLCKGPSARDTDLIPTRHLGWAPIRQSTLISTEIYSKVPDEELKWKNEREKHVQSDQPPLKWRKFSYTITMNNSYVLIMLLLSAQCKTRSWWSVTWLDLTCLSWKQSRISAAVCAWSHGEIKQAHWPGPKAFSRKHASSLWRVMPSNEKYQSCIGRCRRWLNDPSFHAPF
jgi:hypothetical protein